MKVLSKISKAGESHEKAKAGQAEYKETEQYKKWVKDHEGVDEEDLPLTDPEGWEIFVKATEKPFEFMLDFASNVAQSNPENPGV